VAGKIPFFRMDFMNCVYTGANAFFFKIGVFRWLGLRMEWLSIVLITSVAWFCLLMKGRRSATNLVVTLQLISDMYIWFSMSIRMYTDIETYMTCSQRMLDYTTLEIEDDLEKDSDAALSGWPTKGEIEFSDVTMTYRPELAPAIKDLTFRAQAGMKIGICGRTGSGKSSVLQALFRLVDLDDGAITIDGVDIKTTGLHLLRK
jgi:ATP-binding cassette, subfamily C (CFTR/MRP), member 1